MSIPATSFAGRLALRAADTYLYGAASAPTASGGFFCPAPGEVGGIAFSWVAASDLGGEVQLGSLLQRSSPTLLIPALSLPTNANVVPQLTACYASNSQDTRLCDTVQLRFGVAPSPLAAVLSGANATVGNLPVVLDASASFDPDSLPGQLAFAWSCRALFGDGVCRRASDRQTLQLPQGSASSVNVSLLGDPTTGNAYVLSVVVSKGNRSVTASGTLVVIAGARPVVTLQGLPQDLRVNPSARLFIEGSVRSDGPASTLSTWWVVLSGPPGLNLNNASQTATSVNSTSLVLLPGALRPRSTYTLRLYALDKLYGLAFADVAFATAGSPRGAVGPLGGVTVTPDFGFAFETTFQARWGGGGVSAHNAQLAATERTLLSLRLVPSGLTPMLFPTWAQVAFTDWLEEDAPLSFQLSYSIVGSPSGDLPVTLSTFKPGSSVAVRLPSGLPGNGSALVLQVLVRNALGAATTTAAVSRPVRVLWRGGLQDGVEQEAAVSAATAQAIAAVAVGSADAALAAVTGTAQLLNTFAAGESGAMPPSTTTTTTSSDYVDGTGGGINATRRSAQRDALVNVIAQASRTVVASAESRQAVAAAVGAVASAPGELSPTAQTQALGVLTAMATTAAASGIATQAATVDALSGGAAAAIVDALSGVVDSTLVGSGPAGAAARRELLAGPFSSQGGAGVGMGALGAAVGVLDALAASLSAQLSLPGEAPTNVLARSGRIAMSVQSVQLADSTAPSASTSAFAAAGARQQAGFTAPGTATSFAPLPAEATARLARATTGGPSAGVLSQFFSLAFLPYPDPDFPSSTADAAAQQPTARLRFADPVSGAEIALGNLSTPIVFSMPSPVGVSGGAPVAATCRYWDVRKQRLTTEGCFALPSPRPPASALTVAWLPEAQRPPGADLSALWEASGPLMENCRVAWIACSSGGGSALGRPPAGNTSNSTARSAFPPTNGSVAFLNPARPLAAPSISCPSAEDAQNASAYPNGAPALLRVFVGSSCKLWQPQEEGGPPACWWDAGLQRFAGDGCVAAPQLDCACRRVLRIEGLPLLLCLFPL